MMDVLQHVHVCVQDVLLLVMQPIVTIPVIIPVQPLVQEHAIGPVLEDAVVIPDTIN